MARPDEGYPGGAERVRSQHGGSRQDGSEAHRPHLSLQVFSVLSCVSCDLLFPMHLAFPAPWLYNRRACRGGRETCCRGEHENAVLEPDMDPSPHGPALSRGTHNSGGAGPAFYLPPVSRVGCAVHTIFPSLPRESVIPESCAFGPEQETGNLHTSHSRVALVLTGFVDPSGKGGGI